MEIDHKLPIIVGLMAALLVLMFLIGPVIGILILNFVLLVMMVVAVKFSLKAYRFLKQPDKNGEAERFQFEETELDPDFIEELRKSMAGQDFELGDEEYSRQQLGNLLAEFERKGDRELDKELFYKIAKRRFSKPSHLSSRFKSYLRQRNYCIGSIEYYIPRVHSIISISGFRGFVNRITDYTDLEVEIVEIKEREKKNLKKIKLEVEGSEHFMDVDLEKPETFESLLPVLNRELQKRDSDRLYFKIHQEEGTGLGLMTLSQAEYLTHEIQISNKLELPEFLCLKNPENRFEAYI